MHICFISREYPPLTGWGGIGSYTCDLAHGLVNLGHQVTVISLSITQSETEENSDGIKIIRCLPRLLFNKAPVLWRLNRYWPGFAWAAMNYAKKINRIHKIDIIESAECRADAFFALLLFREPKYVVRLHTSSKIVDRFNKVFPTFSRKIVYWMENVVIHYAHALTAPSEAIINLTRSEHHLRKKCVKIFNPINDELFKPAELSKEKLVLFVGRLEENKGVNILYTIIPMLLDADPEIKMRIVGVDAQNKGENNWKNRLLHRLTQAQKCRVEIEPLERTELVQWYNRASVTLVLSKWESFSYIALESLACGCPVIAFSAGGISEVVRSGIDGYLIEYGCIDELVKRVINLLCDSGKCTEMGKSAINYIKNKFGFASIVPKVIRFYEDILESKVKS